ncbi:SEC-C motif domain-containing protein [Mycobacterium tuberculosis]|nr:SEC-C metal-binding domain-containing protein [Mycobacterium tuberculosis]SGO59376.1 SEC-C motif domain-containing protein [Mycobacterium tuberculosis]
MISEAERFAHSENSRAIATAATKCRVHADTPASATMSDNGASRVPPVDETPAAESAEPITAVSLAWLPAGDYERALDLWPDFAGSDLVTGPDGPVAHPLYCRRMQQKLVEFAEAGFPGLAVAAIRVAPFAAWCAEQGQEPDSPEARAEYAAYLTAHGDHDVMAWPPGRNQQCWCGSGHKYKKCCAAASFIDTEPAP